MQLAMRFLKLLGRPYSLGIVYHCTPLSMMNQRFSFTSHSEEQEEDMEMREFSEFMNSLKNYEKSGVPKGAGTDSDDGFDLGRMRRLLGRLGNPHTRFKAVHIAGTKGKGSTAAFLSNILRAEGYRVGCYTSPHIQTMRERISVGKSGEPVEASKLNGLLRDIKVFIDESMKHENGLLSHFEVFTAMAFALFARGNVDIAVIEAGLGGARDATNVLRSHEVIASIITTIGEEHLDALGGSLESIAIAKAGIIKQGRPVVLGGPFLSHIMDILYSKGASMGSPVVLASGTGNRSSIRGMGMLDGRPCQSCDIMMNIEGDLQLSVRLPDVRLFMLGRHQLQNAVTATCSALCLRKLGWTISDRSIRDGLESTYMLGRTQFLTSEEANALGLPGATILLDGAHTKESAKALVDTVKMAFPVARLAVVVAMASDKDHVAFAKEFLSGARVEIAMLTEVPIAGGSNRTTSSISLRDCWIQASEELGINVLHDRMSEFQESSFFENRLSKKRDGSIMLGANNSLSNSMQVASKILRKRAENESAILVVTGSLHIVSSVLFAVRNA